jgi:hypothetical protein
LLHTLNKKKQGFSYVGLAHDNQVNGLNLERAPLKFQRAIIKSTQKKKGKKKEKEKITWQFLAM